MWHPDGGAALQQLSTECCISRILGEGQHERDILMKGRPQDETRWHEAPLEGQRRLAGDRPEPDRYRVILVLRTDSLERRAEELGRDHVGRWPAVACGAGSSGGAAVLCGAVCAVAAGPAHGDGLAARLPYNRCCPGGGVDTAGE
ncbi:hypothetical protein NDU88_004180 [Pleurodeles waltl]|uniref:Uncharacterized protein n=1 Tax=Pleurodeles waltl TaxID=8319 RepID=A0AAV7L0Q2_PLEWA|nr:hypothetical protein NDU88_004180 [Pleurodeles waltl]